MIGNNSTPVIIVTKHKHGHLGSFNKKLQFTLPREALVHSVQITGIGMEQREMWERTQCRWGNAGAALACYSGLGNSGWAGGRSPSEVRESLESWNPWQRTFPLWCSCSPPVCSRSLACTPACSVRSPWPCSLLFPIHTHVVHNLCGHLHLGTQAKLSRH